MSSTVDDEVVWDRNVVADLVAEHRVGSDDLGYRDPVGDLRAMVTTLLAHVDDGSGAEHYVAAPELLAELVSRFESRRTLGGTGVRAGVALAATGVASTVVMAAADPDVHRLLPPLCRAVAASETARLVPHLVVQYPAGATFEVGGRTVVAPAPNRVIFAHDVPNEELRIPESYAALVAGAKVVLVSSLNAIRDEEVLARRLAQIGAALREAPGDATLVWEDAAYHVAGMALRVTRAMAPRVHVVSMNEDELQAYVGWRVDLLDADAVAHAATAVRELTGARTLVVHTRWWSLAVGEEAERHRPALRGGIAMASARYAYGDDIGIGAYTEATTWPSDPRSLRVAAALAEAGVVCEPAVVPPATVPTTIGLGDTFIGGYVRVLAEGG